MHSLLEGMIMITIYIPGYHFCTSGAPWQTILPPQDNPGRQWQQQDGLKMVLYRILFDLGVIWGAVYISLLSSETLKLYFDNMYFRTELIWA